MELADTDADEGPHRASRHVALTRDSAGPGCVGRSSGCVHLTRTWRGLRAHGIAPGNLEIELTETAIIAHPERARALLVRLHEAGVRVSLDDFGQGYTSLAHLARLPLSELKIDRSFIAAMPSTRQDKTIVRTVIELGHQLGLQVVAEGAETDDAVAALAALGCDTVQGFAFTPPLTADDTLAWIDNHARFGPDCGVYASDTWSPARIFPAASTPA